MLTPTPLAPLNDAPHPLSVRQITLSAFRNYEDIRLSCDESPVVLVGANGSGKTNLLEAISLLVPGKGLRRAHAAEWQNRDTTAPWGVAMQVDTALGLLPIGTGRATDESEGERRRVHIDGQNKRGQNALAEHIAMAWITPDMDRVLAESAAGRRKLLDRMAFSFDPAHGGRVNRYEKAMRERLRLLREGTRDATWLGALENEMAQTGAAIAAARRHMIRQLQTAIAETSSSFPRADFRLKGMAEEALEDTPALLVEDRLRAALSRTRGEDALAGTTAIGAHRTDLLVTHRAKNCPAELCSTGEQKALLIAMMIAYVRTIIGHRHLRPLFLLDDIAAHLDSIRRAALFDEIQALGVQAWLTGTDQNLFTDMQSYAQIFMVSEQNGQGRVTALPPARNRPWTNDT